MDLHNDAVFEADAYVDQGRRRGPKSKTLAEDMVTAAQGGLDIPARRYSHDENTPLLGAAGGSGASGNDNGADSEWDGYADFEGLPWYRTPSVRVPVAPF